MLAKSAHPLFSSPRHLVKEPKEMLTQWVPVAPLPREAATKPH